MKKKINLALVCTMGGHFEQITNLSEFYNNYDHFWITNRNKQTTAQLQAERKYFIIAAHYKKPWTYLYQIPFVVRIFFKEKPTHILSTGSGRTALIPFLLARALRIKFLYIDTFSRVNGYSKFGTFMLKSGHPILTQWNSNDDEKAIYIGPVFKNEHHPTKESNSGHIFVTVGTRYEPFTRLLQAVEVLVKNGMIKEKVVVQAGHTSFRSEHLEIFDFCAPERIDELISAARFVITQESAGIGTKCLKYKTRFLVMPRDYQYGELPVKSDMNEDLHFKLQEMGYTKVINAVWELESAIKEIDSLKTGFNFDNQLAVATLTRMMQNS